MPRNGHWYERELPSVPKSGTLKEIRWKEGQTARSSCAETVFQRRWEKRHPKHTHAKSHRLETCAVLNNSSLWSEHISSSRPSPYSVVLPCLALPCPVLPCLVLSCLPLYYIQKEFLFHAKRSVKKKDLVVSVIFLNSADAEESYMSIRRHASVLIFNWGVG